MPAVKVAKNGRAGNWSFLWGYLRREPRQLILLGVVLLVGMLFTLAGPWLLRYFIDSVVHGMSGNRAVTVAVAFIAIGLVARGLQAFEAALAESLAWRSTNQLRLDTLEHVLNLRMSFHHEHSPGELVERVDGDVSLLSNLFSRFVVTVAAQALLLGGVLVALFVIEWRIGVLLTALVAVCVWILKREARWGREPFVAYRATMSRMTGFIEERISAIEDIQTSGAIAHTLRRFARLTHTLLRAELRAVLVGSSLIWASASVLTSVATACALGAAAWLMGSKLITIGTVYLIYAYVQQIQQPLIELSRQIQDYQQAMAGLTRVRQIHAVEPEPPGGRYRLPTRGALGIEFAKVGFAYHAGHAVLHDISFTVPAASSMGVVGPTGSGKTTISRLAASILTPTSGTIRIGDLDVATVALESLRDRVALVTQNVHLIGGSVRDNVTVYADSINDDVILRAIDLLGLQPWLDSLPDGLDTRVGDHENRMSAGQEQLLALTRVFVRDPAVVILDEASSRLDPLTESLLERAITGLVEGRTALVIAHRLHTLHHMDRIVVLDHGEIAEIGDRTALMDNPDSRFASLLSMARR